jgi:hypothetical protein
MAHARGKGGSSPEQELADLQRKYALLGARPPGGRGARALPGAALAHTQRIAPRGENRAASRLLC